MKLDSLDERLIKMLQDDAHQSSEALTKELGISSSTVRRRINRLLGACPGNGWITGNQGGKVLGGMGFYRS